MNKNRTMFFCLLIVFSLILACYVYTSHENSVRVWAEENGYAVIEISRVFNPLEGPFWRYRGDDLLKATLERNKIRKTAFFHFNIFGMRQAWK